MKNKIKTDTNFLIKIFLGTLLWVVTLTSCVNANDTEPLLEVSTTSVSLPAEGGTLDITITSNDQWSIGNSADSWLQLSKTSGKSENIVIQLTAGLNDTGSTRSTILIVSSQNGQSRRITVSQDPQAEPDTHDPNFYVFLCFGQSNMQGSAPIENQDRTVDGRFKVFQALGCSNLARQKGTWYTAVPPTCQCNSGLSPADYFGRTVVANLPDSITVGIINVSVAGCDIRLFDKDIYKGYTSTHSGEWFTSIIAGYEGNPYQYLINLAKTAQKDGVIKGILLHQGETNNGQQQWPEYVKKIYGDMLTDLSLDAASVPLLAGELLDTDDSCCSGMNPIIGTLPDVIPTAHVISSSDCTGLDNAHFDQEGYRELGRRYGVKMLSLLGYEVENEGDE